MRKSPGKRRVSRASTRDPIPPAVPTRQKQDAKTGRFLPIDPNDLGTMGAHTGHGLRAARVPPEFVALEQRFLEAALVDEGEREEDIPARRRSQVQYRAVLHRQILMLDAALRVHGVFDKRNKLRVAWLQQLVALVGRAESVDRLLGLARRQRNTTPPTLDQWIPDTPDIERQ